MQADDSSLDSIFDSKCRARKQLSEDDVQMPVQVDISHASYDDANEKHSALRDESRSVDSNVRDKKLNSDLQPPSASLTSQESIDSDLVYSRCSFEARVEGQAAVSEGDRLFLMDDSNSHWWLVKVIKTQEVGYIPARIIETPVERLARLNKTGNGSDLLELQENVDTMHDEYRAMNFYSSGDSRSPSPLDDVPSASIEIEVERHTVTAIL